MTTATQQPGEAYGLGWAPYEFRGLVKVDIESGCWLWEGALNGAGYGQLQWRKQRWLVHRLAYEWFVGPIPGGLQIDHLCRVRNCANPGHLEAVTLRENLRRGNGMAGRHARQTHCKHGHPFDETNTYLRGSHGWRVCRECARRTNREYKQRLRERAAA